MERNARSIATLSVMAVLTALCFGLSRALRSFTGNAQLDGIIGVVFGLFVCSFPVRHFLDILLYWRIEGRRFRTRRALSWWIACNGIVLLGGWLVIVAGAMRFIPAR